MDTQQGKQEQEKGQEVSPPLRSGEPKTALKPRATTGLDLAFGPSSIRDWMPAYKDLPPEFKDWNRQTPWNKLVSTWFFSGLSNLDNLTAKPGIIKTQALNHIKAIMGSFEPKHEHKEAGCAYLFSLWFEPITLDDVKAMSKAEGGSK